MLKKKTKPFVKPCKFINFKRTKVITVMEMARTVRNPVFIPKIRNIVDAISDGFAADKLDKVIFSVDAKRGTLRIAFIKNKINKVTDTVFK